MKRILSILIITGFLFGCTDKFQEINTNPEIGVPPAEFLLTFIEKELVTYKGGGEWYHENHQNMAWNQYLVMGYANNSNINLVLHGSKYETFFNTVMNHVNEIKYMISQLPEEQQTAKKKLVAAAEVMQAFFALRITDEYGDIPYSEGNLGRHEGKLDPVYDEQETVLLKLLDELDNAIAVLDENLPDEFNFGSADFIYEGNAVKWIRMANAVKLRIATRFESQDLNKAKEIIAEVVADGRLFESDDDQFTIDIGQDFRGGGGAGLEWKGILWAPQPLVNFMKGNKDPRIRIFYEPNGYTDESIAAYADPADIPGAIDIVNDNEILYYAADGEPIRGYRYIGAPTNPNLPNAIDVTYYPYIDDPDRVGPNTMGVSKWHRRLIQSCDYNYNGLPPATGNYVDVQLTYAEVCFMMAEFILKEYTTGNAEEWYNKGVASSLRTYSMIGERGDLVVKVASKVYQYQPVSLAEIDAYLQDPTVAFNGTNDLEKVYVQQYINFFRLPDEGWRLAMRTGYPKEGSSLLERVPAANPDWKYPRRIPTPEPGDLNKTNWDAANARQGFSGLDENPVKLNSERMWWDQDNPEIGTGK